jgi:GNAT superfamily N-acetyltransferase
MAAPSVRIIQAESPADLACVSELFLEYATSLGWDLSQGGRFADEIAAPPGPYAPPAGSLMLAIVDDEAAGVLGLQPVPVDVRVEGVGAATAGELKRLFVRDGFRRLGIGRALMVRAEDEARSRDYDHLVLTTSEQMFPLAQSVYDVLGYGPTQPYRSDMGDFTGVRWLGKNL